MQTDAIIFDFDDTLVITNDLYDQAREQFYGELHRLGIRFSELWPEYLDRADIYHVEQQGYLSHCCFPLALRDTYYHFADLSGVDASAQTAELLEQIGWQIHDVKPTHVEGAVPLLQQLQGKARLFLLTQGDLDTQARRLQASGLLDYFSAYRVVKKKDAASYGSFLSEHQINASASWMVGNSIRADINPALAVGLRAVHLDASAWAYDLVDPVGPYETIHHLSEFLELFE